MLKEESVVRVGGRGRNIHFTLDDEAPMWELERQIRQYLDGSGGFFLGARVSVDVGRRLADFEQIEQLRELLEREYLLEVSQWRTDAYRMEVGLSQVIGASTVILPPECEPSLERTMLVKGACRSGAKVHHEGDLVVLGDVNPGAEVTAAGDIIVFGSLQGVAAAGIYGDESAVVAALSLNASQLRISRHVEVGLGGRFDKKRPRGYQPKVALIQEGKIVLKPFDGQYQRFRAMEGQ